MLAYSRGSKRLAGAAPMGSRVPATVGAFCSHVDIAQWVEHQPIKLTVAGSNPVIQPLRQKRANPSNPGWAPADRSR
jgi:hypothetical protein